MKTLIKNGRVVTAVDDYRADIFTRGETVTTRPSGSTEKYERVYVIWISMNEAG